MRRCRSDADTDAEPGRRRWLTPAGSSPARHAGSGWPGPGRGRGRSATASSRRSSRSSSRTCRARRSSTCSRAAARPASRPSRGAPRRPRSSSATRRPPRSSAPTSSGPTSPAAHARVVDRRRRRWLAAPGARIGAFDVVIVDPPYDEPDRLAGALERSGPQPRPARPASWPSTRAGTPPPAAAGLLASERERRFGETTLTFYRRRGGAMSDRGLSRLVRPRHQRPPRHHGAGRRPSSTGSSSASSRTRARRRCSRPTTRSRSSRAAIDGRRPRRPTASRSTAFDGLTVDFGRAKRRDLDRPRPAGHQRLRGRAAAGPQQPRARARRSTRSSS